MAETKKATQPKPAVTQETKDPAIEAREKELRAIQARKNEIIQSYEAYKKVLAESDSVIDDLSERLSKQREARMVIYAKTTQLEGEFDALTARENQLREEK